MTARSRERLRPWLEACLDDERVPGLRWLNKEEGVFRIPWKHAGKQDWKPDNSAVFVEWAKHTGKYREGIDDPEYAKFKTRLRCAFNKSPGLQEMKDLSHEEDPDEPYKVYRMLASREAVKHKLPSGAESSDSSEPRSTAMRCRDYTSEHMANEQMSASHGFPPAPASHGFPPAMIRGEHSVALPSMGAIVQILTENVKSMSISGESFPSELKNLHSDDLLGYNSAQHSFSDLLRSKPDSQMDTSSGRDGATGFEGEHQAGITAAADAAGGALGYQTQYPVYVKQDLSPTNPASQPAADGLSYSPASAADSSYPSSIRAFSPAGSTSSHTNRFKVNKDSGQYSPQVFKQLQFVSECTDTGATPASAVSAAGTNVDDSYPTPTIQQVIQLQGHEMVVRIFYSSVLVFEQVVTDYPDGVRLYYSGGKADVARIHAIPLEYRTALFGSTEKVLHIHFPQASVLKDMPSLPNSELIQKYTQGLLDSTSRGLLVQCENGNIFATRFCKCVTFHTSAQTNGLCRKMQRPDKNMGHMKQQVFNSLAESQAAGNRGVFFMFGQEGNIAQLNSVLIAVQVSSLVTPHTAEQIPSINMSRSNEWDKLNDQYQEQMT